jgi:hypothetical protein
MFLCPACGRPALTVEAALDLPPDARSDEIRVQLLRCGACDARGVGVYEESRRGALDSDSFEHSGQPASPSDYEFLRSLCARCPAPEDPRCACLAHLTLSGEDAAGRWLGVDRHLPGSPRGYWPLVPAP